MILYARTSGSNQASGFRSTGSLQNSLGRQIKELRAYAKENYPGCRVNEFTDVGSGISMTRPKFQRMINAILKNEFDNCVLLCSFRDRVCRFAFELVAQICHAHNIKIDYASDDPDQLGDDEQLATTVLDFIHIFSSKRYAKRSAAARTKKIPQEKIQEGIRLLKSGWSIRAIGTQFVKDGVRDQNGKPITFNTLRNHMLRQKEMLELVTDDIPENSFERFFKAKLRQCSKKTETNWKRLLIRYTRWCSKKDELKITNRAIKKHLEALGIEHYVRSTKGTTELTFKGLSVLR